MVYYNIIVHIRLYDNRPSYILYYYIIPRYKSPLPHFAHNRKYTLLSHTFVSGARQARYTTTLGFRHVILYNNIFYTLYYYILVLGIALDA